MNIKNVANLIIINNRKEILIAKRSSKSILYPGFWSIPGGTSEYGESIEDTIHREINEELGSKIKNLKYFKSYFIESFKKQATRAFYFYGEIEGDIIMNYELSELRRYSINDIIFLNLNMAFEQEKILEDFLKFIKK